MLRPRRTVAVVLALGVALLSAGSPAGANHRETREGDGLVTSIRWAGQNRLETAAKIATEFAPGNAVETPDTAVLARADLFPDALAGSFLAGQSGAPILLTERDQLSDETAAKLGTGMGNLGVRRVVLTGGVEAISTAVEQELQDAGFEVSRLSGDDRNETAAEIATSAGAEVGVVDGVRTAIVARNDEFPDALAAGALAYSAGLPLLLTARDALPEVTRQALEELDVQQVIIPGGEAAVSATVANQIAAEDIRVIRRAGTTRTGTAVDVAEFAVEELGFGIDEVALARGDAFPDALALGPFAGRGALPILLTTNATDPSTETRDALDDLGTCAFRELYIAGGIAAVAAGVEREARELLTVTDACQLTLEPESQTATVGETVTVTTAVADNAGTPVEDAELDVRFEVYRAESGTATTGSEAAYQRVESVTATGRIAPETETAFSYAGSDVALDIVVVCPDEGASCLADGGAVLRVDDAGEPTNLPAVLTGFARVRFGDRQSVEEGVNGPFTFDNGAQGWTVLATTSDTVWKVQPPGNASPQAFAVSPYGQDASTAVTSPELVSPGGQSTLRFDYTLNTEVDFDFLTIQGSTDGVRFFSIGEPLSGLNPSYPDFDTLGLQFVAVPGPLFIRFQLSSDQLVTTVDGVRIDNVVVE